MSFQAMQAFAAGLIDELCFDGCIGQTEGDVHGRAASALAMHAIEIRLGIQRGGADRFLSRG